jgi:hypothetical protein
LLFQDETFGRKSQKAHTRQVGEYVGLIQKMGYPRVEGFIWYVETGKIVPA